MGVFSLKDHRSWLLAIQWLTTTASYILQFCSLPLEGKSSFPLYAVNISYVKEHGAALLEGLKIKCFEHIIKSLYLKHFKETLLTICFLEMYVFMFIAALWQEKCSLAVRQFQTK